ncbi:MAG: CBS domain-containing protein [Ardenticatenaceae bacterium]|nr:CBS domain-containing protein [Ardenticatenaceae bacterium]
MTLEQELQAEQVSHLDLSGFSQVASGTLVREAVATMRAERHNVCLIVADNQLIGIFTDRDVLRKVAADPETLNQSIDTVMTAEPITIQPDSSAATALRLMDDNHFRNLPAVDETGKIVGNMTHQAIVNYLATRYPVEVLNQPPRPDQFPSKAEGG